MKYIKKFDKLGSDLVLYHGTDIYTEDGNSFQLPIWLTKDFSLAGHFSINPKSSSKRVDKGYVYKLKITNPIYKVIDSSRILLESGEIYILEIKTTIPNKITQIEVIDIKSFDGNKVGYLR